MGKRNLSVVPPSTEELHGYDYVVEYFFVC